MKMLLVVVALLIVSKVGWALDVANTVSHVRDGEVRLSFTPRDAVCGDGADMIIADHKRYLYPGTTTYGDFPRSVDRRDEPQPGRPELDGDQATVHPVVELRRPDRDRVLGAGGIGDLRVLGVTGGGDQHHA